MLHRIEGITILAAVHSPGLLGGIGRPWTMLNAARGRLRDVRKAGMADLNPATGPAPGPYRPPPPPPPAAAAVAGPIASTPESRREAAIAVLPRRWARWKRVSYWWFYTAEQLEDLAP